MALIDCDECGRRVSDKAVSCPGCGAPVAAITSTAKHKNISSSNDQVLYNFKNVNISASKAQIDGCTYPISNITSVKTTKNSQTFYTHRGIYITSGVGLAIAGLMGVVAGAHLAGLSMALAGALIIYIAGVYAEKSKVIAVYTLVITTSSGESNALSSTDRGDVSDVEKALSKAIVARG